MFRCSQKCSAGTTQKVVFHLISKWIFGKLFVTGKQLMAHKVIPRNKPHAYHVTIEPRANGRDIVGQHTTPIWLDATCCVCCCMLLSVVGSRCAKFETGQATGSPDITVCVKTATHYRSIGAVVHVIRLKRILKNE